MSHLFDPLPLRGITLRNRIGVSPMCQYSCEQGFASDWHLVHLGSRAVGGAGLVIMEATAVTPEGRISNWDLGLWSDAHIEALLPLTRFLRKHGAAPGIQIAHAGRKAGRVAPWVGDRGLTQAEGAWQAIGPSALAFNDNYPTPDTMNFNQIQNTIQAFAQAAERALKAGFQLLELHAAHGYLLHSFLSPLSNLRTDQYGGSFANRSRFLLETVRAVRLVWPETLPLAVRLSCSDWAPGGWAIEDSVALTRLLQPEGVDFIDCSSGGAVADALIPVAINYQVPFAKAIRQQTDVPTAAVGMITEAKQADDVIQKGEADLVFLGRELLRDPYWPLHAMQQLRVKAEGLIPSQYLRAFPHLP